MVRPIISIIAAIGKNRELGKDNKLLWHIPEDLKRFRKLTQGHAVIMGRKTFESIGKALPNRINIIISNKRGWTPLGCLVTDSIESAIELAKKSSIYHLTSMIKDEVFVVGGGQIFTQALPYAGKLYLTIVDKTCDADTFFPNYPTFKKVVYKETKKYEGLTYTFLDLEKE